MMNFLLISVLLIHQFFVKASAQVDPSQGTYSCYPCGRAMCGFADGGSADELIDTSAIAGNDRAPPRTCKEIQTLADMRKLDPEVCSIYSQVTLSSEDPCDCRERTIAFSQTATDKKCVSPLQPQPCQLCGRGKMIGDPEKVLPEGLFRTTCIKIYDVQNENLAEGQGGFSRSMCNGLQGLFTKYCQCVSPGTPVEQCIPQETFDQECDLKKSDDQCCTGHCRYLHTYRRNMCTFKPEEPAPPSFSFPTREPAPNPTSSPGIIRASSTPTDSPAPSPIPTSIYLSPAPSKIPTESPSILPTTSPDPTLYPSQSPTIKISAIPSSSLPPIQEAPPFSENLNQNLKSYFRNGGGAGGIRNRRNPPNEQREKEKKS